MDDFPRLQFDDEEGKKRTEEQVCNLKEIAGPDLARMIAQKRPPVLPRRARRAHTPHAFLDRSFADVDIQFQQLAPNPFSPPESIVACYLFDQCNGLGLHLRVCWRCL